jgi:signal transduction histidine kinase
MRRTPTEALKRVAAWANPRVLAGGRAVRGGLVMVLTTPDPPPIWRGRWRRRFAFAAVGALTLVLGSAALAGLFSGRGVVTDIQGALIVAAVAVVIRYPLLSWRLAWLALTLTVLFGDQLPPHKPWSPLQLPVLLAAFWIAGIRHGRPLIWWTWAFGLLPLWLWLGGHTADTGRAAATVAFTAAAVAVDSLSSRRHAQRDLAEQAELTELEQARRAVLTERTRIARELHDVVAHHMSLIAVRAETAPYRLSEIEEPVRAEFHALSGAAREALTDMRRLLGVLRDDGPAGRAPQPQLPDLRALVASARLAGLAVDLSLPRDLSRIPASVGVCAYRIVQESLSNASRHAPGAAVTVGVDRDEAAIWLRVANGPAQTRRRADDGHGPGQGLVGMHERVTLLGGHLSAGPEPGGGFVVAARLPIGPPTSSPVAVAAEPRLMA